MTIEERVLKIISKEVKKFKKDISFVEQGIDSVTFVKILAGIEDEFNILFPDDYLYINKDSSLNDLFNKVMNVSASFGQIIQSIDGTTDK